MCPILEVGDNRSRPINTIWHHLHLQFLNGGGVLSEGQDLATDHYVFNECGFGQSIDMIIFFLWDLYEFHCKGLTRLPLNKGDIFLPLP